MKLIKEIAANETLDEAYQWLCKRRQKYTHNDDVWMLRERWPVVLPQVRAALLEGEYRLSALRRIYREQDGPLEIWSACDALVLKAVAIVLTRRLVPKLSKRCHHLAGHGGAKAAVREITRQAPQHKFVFRSDVKSYYASIDHEILQQQLAQSITDPIVLDLLGQYMRRTINDGGRYEDVNQGIALGCSLSPLMGAIYLDRLDRRMEKLGVVYARFMDDWVVLAPTRWKLRRAVKIVNRTLAELRVEQHPDKTFVGQVARGFDFLGYRITPRRLGIARQTRVNFDARILRLYEQGADQVRIGDYVRRWLIWIRSGLRGLLFVSTPTSGAHVCQTHHAPNRQ